MPARGEVEAHESVAGLKQRQKHRLVHLAAGVRLHVGEVRAEQLLGALDRERLGDVHELAAAVVALARIALGVFVGHHRALRLEHGARHDVLRGDQLDLVLLATELLRDRVGDLRIRFGERRGEEGIFRGRLAGWLALRHSEASADDGSSRRLAALQQPPSPRDTTATLPRQAKRRMVLQPSRKICAACEARGFRDAVSPPAGSSSHCRGRRNSEPAPRPTPSGRGRRAPRG